MSKQSNKLSLGILFRQKREEKGLLVRQVAAVTELDQAIISRIENCERIPTREQVLKLAGLYNLDVKEIMSAWLAEKMVRDYGNELYVTNAFKLANESIIFNLQAEHDIFYDSSKLSNNISDEPDGDASLKRKPRRKSNKPDKS